MKILVRSLLIVVFAFSLSAVAEVKEEVLVVYPRSGVSEEKEAAEEFAEYWEKLTDAEVAVEREKRRPLNRPRSRFGKRKSRQNQSNADLLVFVGETGRAKSEVSLPDELDAHGFRIKKEEETLFLRGKTPLATQFAVSDLLQKEGGIRWYMPTKLGEHIPEKGPELADEIDRIEEPDFVSRRWGNWSERRHHSWSRQNKTMRRDEFHHYLHTIFTEEVYDERSDFFLMMNGE